MFVVEDDGGDDVPFHLLEVGVGFDVLMYRLADGAEARAEPLGPPGVIEPREHVVGDVEARTVDSREGSADG